MGCCSWRIKIEEQEAALFKIFAFRYQFAFTVLALKMGFYNCIPSILELLFSDDEEFVHRLKRLLVNVDVRIFKNIDKIVGQIV